MGSFPCGGIGVMDALGRLRRARTALILNHPFFATLALRLKLREDCSCHDAWTDGEVLGCNPLYIESLTDAEVVGLMAHLVMHPACGHHLRRRGRDMDRWNIACDYAINWILVDAGFTLPQGSLLTEGLREVSAEAIYSRLFPKGLERSSKGSAGEGEGRKENTPPAGEVRDAPRRSQEADLGAEGTQWQHAFACAVNSAIRSGTLPTGVARLAAARLYPQMDWREILSRFIERSARFDYSWLQPNRRYLHQGWYFPGMVTDGLEEVVVAVDTSGSISKSEMAQFAAELSAIMGRWPATLHLFYCDMMVREYRCIERSELPLELTPVGGGGTDFRPLFRRVAAEGLRPACLIYLTDLRCTLFPQEEPEYPVLWVQIGDGEGQPPFGEVLPVSDLARGVHEGDGSYK